jgi:DNA-directed RNA polymerase beta subunit
VDIVLNTQGVPRRMNIGQVLETHLGWIAKSGWEVDADNTAEWELRSTRSPDHNPSAPRAAGAFIEKGRLLTGLRDFLQQRRDQLRLATGPSVNTMLRGDDRHMCSACLNPNYLDAILERFDSFLVQGAESSVPYLRKRITDLGKSYRLASTMTIDQELSDSAAGAFDCIIQAGAVGTPKTSLPLFSLQSADFNRGMALNAPDDLGLEAIPMYVTPSMARSFLAGR